MMIYLRLFWEFCKTGLFSVGGGLATLPFLYDISARTGWFTEAQLADMIAISESTPGPIGVNMATYVGFTTAGIPGALAATLGLVFPEIVIILIIVITAVIISVIITRTISVISMAATSRAATTAGAAVATGRIIVISGAFVTRSIKRIARQIREVRIRYTRIDDGVGDHSAIYHASVYA